MAFGEDISSMTFAKVHSCVSKGGAPVKRPHKLWKIEFPCFAQTSWHDVATLYNPPKI